METLRLFLSAQDKTQNVNDKSEVEKERLENMSSSIMGESLAVLLEWNEYREKRDCFKQAPRER